MPDVWGRAGDRQRSEEPPRLVLRFAVLTAIGLALAAAAVLLVVRYLTTTQAERAAARHARFVTDSLLAGELRPADFKASVTGKRRGELDALFVRHVLGDGILLVKLYARDGTITYSNDHTLIGSAATEDLAKVDEVLAGTMLSDVTSITAGVEGDVKVLRAVMPVAFARSEQAGIITLYHDYVPIARTAADAFFPIAGVFEVALLALYAALIPVLRRVSRRIHGHVQEIEYIALHDELTGLPNRAMFRDRIQQAILAARRRNGRVAVLLIDLDRFKEINDALGHQAGDVLLKEIGARLGAVLRADETFSRLGGDEFGVVLPGTSEASVPAAVDRMRAALAEPFRVQGLTLEIDASIGISIYPTSGEDVDTLIQRADVAMYAAKGAKSGYMIYEPDHDPNDPRRLALVGELRRAMETGELALFFQPKAALSTGEIWGAEALLRWQHPEHGLLEPAAFIEAAERTGLFRPVSRYVLEAALRQSRAWREAGVNLQVSVNVTMLNLLDLTFPDEVRGALEKYGLEPHRLELEITESTIMADPFRVRHVLEQLSSMGVRLAIDDFGTGYSSLAYLKRLPINTVKIDKSFVIGMADDPSDATIVRSTIDLARDLSLDVVAEGVETQEIWDRLAALGCGSAQGYLVGRPVPAAELTVRIANSAGGGMPGPGGPDAEPAVGSEEEEPGSFSPADPPAQDDARTNCHGLRVVRAAGR